MATALVVRTANNLGLNLLEDTKQYTNRIQIKSETSNRLYIVAQRKSTGEWGCSCPGYIFYRRCKHLASMLPILLPALEPPKKRINHERKR